MKHSCTAILLTLALSASLHAQASPGEYQVKAAYLFNFGRVVSIAAEQEELKGDSFQICIIGQDPFKTVLDAAVSGQTIGGRAVVPRRISRLRDVDSCRILFVSASEEGRLTEIFDAISGSGILTVSEIADFSRRGGMIEFVLDGRNVRFAVNLTRVQAAGIAVSSDLLKVALTVRRD